MTETDSPATSLPPDTIPALAVGISSCLLGQNVRWDRGHKRDSFLCDRLGPHVRYVPVCPEMGIGLGTPRETIHLERHDGAIRLLGTRTAADHTGAMTAFATATAAQLASEDLCGYVFKKDSPSCGLFRVRIYDPRPGHPPERTGAGLYAAGIRAVFPDLPMEEDGRLNDPRLRENFVERLFAYHRVTQLFRSDWRTGDLVAFHSREKLALMAHSPEAYKALGQLVATAKGQDRTDLAARYRSQYMAALSKLATPGRMTNVLNHMAGYFRRDLDSADRQELADTITEYRNGLVPLLVPLTLIRHYVRKFDVSYLADQTFLSPHPRELMLRNAL